MLAKYEVTDTFGGEANYCWVNRGEVEMKEGSSRLAIIRKIKREIGWSGIRSRTDDFGDQIAIWPAGMCQVCFIDFEY